MDLAKAYEILQIYLKIHEHTGDMTPDEIEAFNMVLNEVGGIVSCQEYARVYGHTTG